MIDGTIITSMYIYSALLKLITQDDAIFGITYIGQFIALKLHGEVTDSEGNVRKPSFSMKEFYINRDGVGTHKSPGRKSVALSELSEVSINSDSTSSSTGSKQESSTGSKQERQERQQKRKTSSVCIIL